MMKVKKIKAPKETVSVTNKSVDKIKVDKPVDNNPYKLIERQFRNKELIKEVIIAEGKDEEELEGEWYYIVNKRKSQNFFMKDVTPLENEVRRVEGWDDFKHDTEISIIRITPEMDKTDKYFKSLGKGPFGNGRTVSPSPFPPDPVFASNVSTEKTPPPCKVKDGFYTCVFKDGDYRTLKVETKPLDAITLPGKTIISYLHGPDNSRDYSGFGFINHDKEGDEVFYLWKKHKKEDGSPSESAKSLVRAVEILLKKPEKAGLEYATRSGNCYRCGRQLTVPASINAGLGPDCAKKV